MAPKGNARENNFKMILTDEERNRLMFLAHREGLPAAAYIRRFVLKEWQKLEDAEFKRDFARFMKAME
jgi:hypothetical protein